nr:recombinase family protein [Candidatus Enterovibrio escacola]
MWLRTNINSRSRHPSTGSSALERWVQTGLRGTSLWRPLVVWKLDRLSRSLKDLLTILEKIEIAGATFLSLTESINTSAPAGRMMMQIVGSFARFERAML